MPIPHRRALARAATAISLLGAAPLAAQNIDTGTPPPSASWPTFSFGRPGATQYSSLGQSFTVPVGTTRLTEFTFWTNDVVSFETLPFHAYVFPWNEGTRQITGAYLFRSAAQTGFAGVGYTPYAFGTGGLDLTAGGTYIAVLSSAEFADPSARTFGGIGESTGGVNSTYAGGAGYARISVAGDGLGGLSAGAWGHAGGTNADLAFTATFVAAPVPSTVPEPATVTLLGAGALGVAVVATRRRAG